MATGSSQIGLRLREVLEYQAGGPRTITWLQAEMEARGVPGSGYSNIQRYVAGNADNPPPIDWLDGAAEALGVRTAWLALGEEPILPSTTADLPVHQLAPSVGLVAGRLGEALIAHIVQRLMDAQPAGSPPPTEDRLGDVMYALHSRALQCLDAVRVETTREEAEPFYLDFLTAMLAAVPRAGQGRNLAEVEELLGPPIPDIFTAPRNPESPTAKTGSSGGKRTSPKDRRVD